MKISVLAFVLTVACYGQQTWGGLSFGMSPREAADVVKANLSDPSTVEDAVTTLSLVRVKVKNQTGTGTISFASGRLKRINLDFSDKETSAAACPYGDIDSAVRRISLVEEIGEALSDKYGRPQLETRGQWPTHSRLTLHFASRTLESIESTRTWKPTGQVVEVKLDLVCGSLFLKVAYRQPENEL